MLNQRAWLGGRTLEEFLIGQSTEPRLAKVDGRIVRITARDYYRYRIGALSELIARHAAEATSLLELGAGYGANLFSLSLDRHWSKLRGFDIAPNGIEAGRQIASHFKLDDRVSFDRIDLTDANDPHFSELAGGTVFTYFCSSRIPYAVEAVIENIIRSKPARVVNIKPGITCSACPSRVISPATFIFGRWTIRPGSSSCSTRWMRRVEIQVPVPGAHGICTHVA